MTVELSIEPFPPSLPLAAELAPHRQCLLAEAHGRSQVFTLDLTTGRRRQVTRRAGGTTSCDIDPSGRQVWWFDDDAAGVGRWQVQPFGGGPDVPALPGVAAGRHAGLAMSADGTAAVGVADATGFDVYLRRGDEVRAVLRHDGAGEVVDLAIDAELLATAGEPESAAAVQIHDLTGGSRPAVLSGAEMPLWTGGFRPGPGPGVLLLTRQTTHGYQVGTWDSESGCRFAATTFDTEIAACWSPDGSVLVRADRHARSALFRIDPFTGTSRRLPTPPGTVLDARPRADGEVHYLWTDATTPPVVRRVRPGDVATTGPVTVTSAGRATAGDLWADGPGGRVHVLWHPPQSGPDRPAGQPTVFLLHGGPHLQDRDAYDPAVALLNAAGLAVARVNYRGSSGYGARWLRDFSAGVGHTQLADVGSARDELVARGWADPHALAVAGWSWGGYLALLAAGVEPDRWRAVAAAYPIADYLQAHARSTTEVRALDERLFGGTPAQVPERYLRASPASYVAQVRAPVLLLAGRHDPRCPVAQIRSYADALEAVGGSARLVCTDAGHGAASSQAMVDELVEVVTFLAGHLHRQPVTAFVGSPEH